MLVPLTPDLVTRFTALSRDINAFWQAHPALHDTILDYTNVHGHSDVFFVYTIFGPIAHPVRVIDYRLWAAREPGIAHLFQAHGIAPQQYRALFFTVREAIEGNSAPDSTSTVVGRNQALTQANQKELAALMDDSVALAKTAAIETRSHQARSTSKTTPGAATLGGQVGTAARPLAITTQLNTPAHAPPIHFGDGHVYLLGFTAYWCEGCPGTYDPMMALAKRYASQGVRAMMVTAFYGQDLDFIKKYFRHYQMTLPVAIEGTQNDTTEATWNPAQRQRYDMKSLPATLVVDQHGIIRYRGDVRDHDAHGVIAVIDSLLQTGTAPAGGVGKP